MEMNKEYICSYLRTCHHHSDKGNDLTPQIYNKNNRFYNLDGFQFIEAREYSINGQLSVQTVYHCPKCRDEIKNIANNYK